MRQEQITMPPSGGPRGTAAAAAAGLHGLVVCLTLLGLGMAPTMAPTMALAAPGPQDATATATAEKSATTGTESAVDGQQIITKVDELMNTDCKMQVSLRFYTKDGLDESYEMTSYTKDNNQKVIVRFSAPASSVGNDLIMLERNVWLYQKKAGRIVRVPSNLSFGGTGFSFGDIVRLNMTDSYIGKITDEDEDTWLVELNGKDRRVPYDRIELRVAKDGFIPIHATCLSRTGNVIKTIDYSEVKTVNGRRKPTVLTVRSPFSDHEVSVMAFSDEVPVELPDHVFNRKNLALRLEERYDTEG